MDVMEEVIHKFVVSNSGLANKFAICGTGKYADLLGRVYDNRLIDCYLDENIAGKYFHDKPVICAADLAKRNISAVIIAASVANEILIYDRIKPLCEKCEIDIYSVHFGQLTHKIGRDFTGKFNELLKTGNAYQNVIINWEDTLLYKGTMGENDFFRLLENRISKVEKLAIKRQYAETILKRKNIKYCLDDVYEEMSSLFSDADIDVADIKKEEEHLLFEIYKPNSVLVEFIKGVCVKGGRLFICNSSIYSNKLILQLAATYSLCDISNINILSLDEMVDILTVDDSVSGNGNSLYIDNTYRVNIAKWRLTGNDVCIVKYDNDELTEFVQKAYFFNTRTLLSLAYKKTGADFSLKSSAEIDNIYDLTYLCIAPLVTAYVIWLARQVSSENFHAVLFAARDGFLIKKLYDFIKRNIINELPPSVYLYTSRVACMKSGVINETDLKVLKYLTELDESGLKSMLYAQDMFSEDKASFLELSSLSRKNYYKYLDDIKVDYLNGRYAFCDLISTGTSQYFLQKLFSNKLKGYYLSFQTYRLGVLQFDAIYPGMRNEVVFSDNMRNLLESILTSKETSLIGFDNVGNPMFSDNKPTQEKLLYIDSAQKAVVDFFCEYCELFYFHESYNMEYMKLIEWIEQVRNTISVSSDIFNNVDLFDDLWPKHIGLSFSKG